MEPRGTGLRVLAALFEGTTQAAKKPLLLFNVHSAFRASCSLFTSDVVCQD